jgi:hypothetical protein
MADFYTTFSGNSQYRHHCQVLQGGQNAAGNYSYVSVNSWVEKTSGSGYMTSNSGNTCSVSGDVAFGGGAWAPYNFASYSSRQILSGGGNVAHASNGTKVASGGYAANDSAGGNFGSANGSWSLGLTTIVNTPATPTSVGCSYVSDTQVSVSWSRPTVTNNAPNTSQIRKSVNGATAVELAPISVTTSVTISAEANQKIITAVREANAAGTSAWSANSLAVYTTPAAPTALTATKDASLDINLAFTSNVGFTEYQHVIEHGTVVGGVTTWDGSELATVLSGVTTYKHVAPNAAQLHVYRVFARNLDAGALSSAKLTSNTVQLLAPPNKPTFPSLGPFVDKAKDFTPTWVHNPVDTTAQTAYEFGYSTNGGAAWSSTGKVTSSTPAKTFAASTYAADVALTVRVRTWGQAATGGSDGTGASPWSDQTTVTFKTRPVVTITGPLDASTYERAALTVNLGFSQAEAATFVNATIKLYDGVGALLETRVSTTRAATLLDTAVDNGSSYTIKVTVIDSNGLVSDEVESDFAVVYTLPVAAAVTATYLPNSGIGQLDITVGSPGVGEVAAALVTITRTINGVVETILYEYPSSPTLTILDMTPTIVGTNEYRVTTISEDGATATTLVLMVTAETKWAFLSSGAGYANIISFGAALTLGSTPTRSSTLVEASGRRRPIALFGTSGTLEVSGTTMLFAKSSQHGSSPAEVEEFVLSAGIVCYRDPSGRRMFGKVSGTVASSNSKQSTFAYMIQETSR